MIAPSFDPVHDIQRGFRRVLDCFSFPGSVRSLAEDCQGLPENPVVSKVLQFLALMLLDAETTFTYQGPNQEQGQTWIARLCYARPRGIPQAQFVLVSQEPLGDTQGLCSILTDCQVGDLENPHHGATLVLEVPDLYQGTTAILRGPGIDHDLRVTLPLSQDLLDLRRNLNREFPLGIDLIVVDTKGDMLCLPRTTLVEVC